jgi:HAD superfamily hydrolase (TIGR01509 family)
VCTRDRDASHRAHAWSGGYDAFAADVFGDADYLATLTDGSDVLEPLQHVLDRHTSGVAAHEIHDLWSSLCTVDSAVLDLLANIDKADIYLASNQDERRAAVVEQTFQPHVWWRGAFFSCRLGARKPDGAYFAATLARLDVPAESCFFVDDKPECVEAAAAAGIPGVVFRAADELAEDLAAWGLLEAGPPLPADSPGRDR